MDVTLLWSLMPLMVCGMWAIVYLLDYYLNRQADRKYLCIFMSAATLLYVGHCVFFMRAVEMLTCTDVVYGMCNLAVYPLFLIYIIYMTTGRVRAACWLMLAPAMLCGVVYAVLYGLMDEAECQHFIQQYLYGNSTSGLTGLSLALAWAHNVSKGLFLLTVVMVFVRGNALIREFRQNVSARYADTEGRMLLPLHVLLYLFTITSLVSVVFLILGRCRFAVGNTFLAIPSILFSSMLFAIGYVCSQPMFSYKEYGQELDEDVPAQELTPEEEHPSRIESLAAEVERLMTEEHLYREHDLRITELARRLGTNSKYISLAINQVIGLSFADYINCQRIRYARELRLRHPDLTVGEIAHRVGYSSMQSFYRNQKKWESHDAKAPKGGGLRETEQ